MLQDNLLSNVFRNQMICKNLAFALYNKKKKKEKAELSSAKINEKEKKMRM